MACRPPYPVILACAINCVPRRSETPDTVAAPHPEAPAHGHRTDTPRSLDRPPQRPRAARLARHAARARRAHQGAGRRPRGRARAAAQLLRGAAAPRRRRRAADAHERPRRRRSSSAAAASRASSTGWSATGCSAARRARATPAGRSRSSPTPAARSSPPRAATHLSGVRERFLDRLHRRRAGRARRRAGSASCRTGATPARPAPAERRRSGHPGARPGSYHLRDEQSRSVRRLPGDPADLRPLGAAQGQEHVPAVRAGARGHGHDRRRGRAADPRRQRPAERAGPPRCPARSPTTTTRAGAASTSPSRSTAPRRSARRRSPPTRSGTPSSTRRRTCR